jgi:purine-binding chemotaxis protein CheW
MTHLYLIVRIAGQLVALDAAEVNSVVEIAGVTPIPRVPAHVSGLFALRSRVLTVIDTETALGYARRDHGEVRTGVIVSIDGHGYALLVDDVADVIEAGAPEPSGALLGPGWARVTLGQVESAHGPLLLVDPTRLIAGPQAAAA